MSQRSSNSSQSRRRFWLWLGGWSLFWAALATSFFAVKLADDNSLIGANIFMMQLVIAFGVLASVVLLGTYLMIFSWRSLPRNHSVRFWLAMGAITAALVLEWHQIQNSAGQGVMLSRACMLSSVLLWLVLFLLLAAFPFWLGRFFCWCFRWRNLKYCLLVVAILTAFAALFYAEENWRGRRAWENYRREWEAKGEKFELSEFAPPAVPDEQNFAMAPVVAGSYASNLSQHNCANDNSSAKIVDRMAMELWRTNLNFPTNVYIGSWQRAKPTALKPWQDYYRTTIQTNYGRRQGGTNVVSIEQLDTRQFPVGAQSQSPAADVLLALTAYDVPLEELRQAGERPYSQFPVELWQQSMELWSVHYHESNYRSDLADCAAVLQLRAIAYLQVGRVDQALSDIKLILRLAESLRTEALLSSQSSRLYIINLALQPIWEGLAEQRWSELQLKELNTVWQKLDTIADLQVCLHGELASGLEYIEMERKVRYRSGIVLGALCPKTIVTIVQLSEALPSLPQPFDRGWDWLDDKLFRYHIGLWVNSLAPDGWFAQNKVTLAKAFQNELFPLVRPEKHLIDRHAITEAEALAEDSKRNINIHPFDVFPFLMLPSLYHTLERAARGQAAIDLATVACALERYRAVHGAYPESLAGLTPEFLPALPPDVVNGEPLRYRRTADGRFLLYSVGWNGKDDGGIVVLRNNRYPIFDQGDWVWQYPAKTSQEN